MRKDKVLVIILIIMSLCQSIILNNIGNFKEEELSKESIIKNDYKNVSVSDINDKFKSLNNVEFLKGTKQHDGSWLISLKIEGEKKDLLASLVKLRNYDIKNYKIEHNKDKSSLIIELSDII
ncbi:hypothetical protein [Clostridium taeniosporum]|uniref:Uncharacterized protein n=1 Tax=Clostridium taeniosporum TaxID=394958 RepID=A0A1D7XL63_9CLOT|nr:hypothetical protein [Clostridium taeniosporum]AOR23920.1 hypothetical protein BGI42_09360 [Clostridium taeniosporum]